MAVRPITKGDAVTEPKLKPKTGATGNGFMTYVVPQGHRAVTVAVNEVAGVAGFLPPSDRVDVIVTTPVPGNETESISSAGERTYPRDRTDHRPERGKPVVVPTMGTKAGKPRAEALKDMAERTMVDDLRSFTTVLTQTDVLRVLNTAGEGRLVIPQDPFGYEEDLGQPSSTPVLGSPALLDGVRRGIRRVDLRITRALTRQQPAPFSTGDGRSVPSPSRHFLLSRYSPPLQ